MGFLNKMQNQLGEVEVDKQRPQNTLTPLEIKNKFNFTKKKKLNFKNYKGYVLMNSKIFDADMGL